MELDVDALAARDFGRTGIDRLTRTARGRFFSSMARSYVTISPEVGGRDRSVIAVMCMNTGSPPLAGVTKPNPRSEFQLVIFPLCRTMFSLPPSLFLTTQPQDYWTRSRPRRSNGSSGSQPVVRPNPSAAAMTGQPRPLLAFPEADSCVCRAARDFVEVARKALVKPSVDTSPSQQPDPRNQKCNEQEVTTRVQ